MRVGQRGGSGGVGRIWGDGGGEAEELYFGRLVGCGCSGGDWSGGYLGRLQGRLWRGVFGKTGGGGMGERLGRG